MFNWWNFSENEWKMIRYVDEYLNCANKKISRLWFISPPPIQQPNLLARTNCNQMVECFGEIGFRNHKYDCCRVQRQLLYRKKLEWYRFQHNCIFAEKKIGNRYWFLQLPLCSQNLEISIGFVYSYFAEKFKNLCKLQQLNKETEKNSNKILMWNKELTTTIEEDEKNKMPSIQSAFA